MNAHITKIKEAVEIIQTETDSLCLESGSTVFKAVIEVTQFTKISANEIADKMQSELNRLRLRNVALAKLDDADREILGLKPR